MRKMMLLSLLIVFAISTAAAAKTWTVYNPVWIGEGTGPTVTLPGLGPDGHDAWWRGNPPDDWAQAHFVFDFPDMNPAKTNYTVEYWCPATPPQYSVGWGPINWPMPGGPGGRNWAGADMSSRAGAWLPITDAGFGTVVSLAKGESLFFLWNPWGGGYSNVVSAVRITGQPIPEPSSLLGLVAGLPALAIFRRKR